MPYLERVEMPQRPWLDHYPADVDPVLQDVTLPHVPALARQAASTYANTIAFTQVMANGMNGSLKYREVDVHSDNFAAYLRETLGLQQGDRVAVQIPNSLAYPIVAFGVMKAGLVLVNTNPLYTASEMTHQFKDSGAKVLVVSDMFADRLPEV
jgi:long-chain acyl-CoA synthetase